MPKPKPMILCSCARSLPEGEMVAAARLACDYNPANAPPPNALAALFGTALVGGIDPRGMIAILTTKYWGQKGRQFGVSFMDNPTQACRTKILSHMNAWSAYCNVSFKESGNGEVRIARDYTGYWSYLGTDILHIPRGSPTMNLQGFTERTPESEYKRVVRHETGHTLGCPHEHMRKGIVSLLDVDKTIAYFRQTQGWSRQEVIQQVLTPVEEWSLMGTASPEKDSIMCYDLPGQITKSGKSVVGGSDITLSDGRCMARLYPK